MKKFFRLALLLVCVAIITATVYAQQAKTTPYVILVSFDGFRYDYAERYGCPNFQRFINEGASAPAMIPSYPSKTFPNHYTLVTGLYPGNHGLVDNSFYDADKKQVFSMKKQELVEDEHFYGGTPLWQLAQQQGLKSASYFWVGSEAPIKGQFPSYYHRYNENVPNKARVEEVLRWLLLPERERPHFISLYFSLVDSYGHDYGPESEEIKQAVMEADQLLGMLMQGVDVLGLPINVIVTSDHGMYNMQDSRYTMIYLDEIMPSLDSSDVVVRGSTQAHVYCNDPEKEKLIYDDLKYYQENYKVYRKNETPPKWNYRNNPRIGDILVVANPGHELKDSRGEGTAPGKKVWGTHGFDPYITPDMGAIFYALGPNIKPGRKSLAFENVHVYPFIAKILGLTIPKVDGDFNVLSEFYRE